MSDETRAIQYLEEMRWRGSPVCPHCGNGDRCYFLTPANGKTRTTRTGNISQRRVWKCGACRRQFSVLTGTVMQGTRIPAQTLLPALDGVRVGVGSRELARRHGFCPRTVAALRRRVQAGLAARDSLLLSLWGCA